MLLKNIVVELLSCGVVKKKYNSKSDLVHFILKSKFQNKSCSIVKFDLTTRFGCGKGNHEGTFEREHHTNLTQRIIKACDAPEELYTGWAAITRVRFEDASNHRSSVRIFHSHGWQAGRMAGAKVNQLDHLMGWIEGCRIYLQGHSHDRVVKTKTMLSTNPSFTKLVPEDSFGAHCGSYLRTYQLGATGYGEEKGFPPVPIGPPIFELTPTETGVKVRSIQGDS